MKKSDADLVCRIAALVTVLSGSSGIVGKAPSYILGKYRLCMALSREFLPSILDKTNRARYEEWQTRWAQFLGGGEEE